MTLKIRTLGKNLSISVIALIVAVFGVLPATARADSIPVIVARWQENQVYHGSGWQVYDTTNDLYAWATAQPGNFFWYGPYVTLRPAVYKACFTYRPTSDNTRVYFDYAYNAGTVYSSTVTYDQYALPHYKKDTACIPINANSATNKNVEFRAMLISGTVRVDSVRLVYDF